jgi:hypothetical protein
MLGILSMLLQGGAVQGPPPPPAASTDAQDVASQDKKVDLATAINASLDSAEIRLSPKMFRAIQAVERYRTRSQRPQLTAVEARRSCSQVGVARRRRGRARRR